MKKLLIVLLLLFPVVAYSQAPINIFVPGIGNKPVQGDVDGTLFNTERYPRESKFALFNLASGATLATGATGETGAATTAFPSSSLQSMKMLRIQATGWTPGASLGGTVNFILQGSYDGVTFAPIYTQSIAPDSLGQRRTVSVDTVQVRFFAATTSTIASPGGWFMFSPSDIGVPLFLPYYRFLVKNRTFGTGNGTITYTIDGYGRQF